MPSDTDYPADPPFIHVERKKTQNISEFIFAFGLNPLPHSNVSDAGPSIVTAVGQSSDAQAAKFLRHFRFDSAISDFPVTAPSAIR